MMTTGIGAIPRRGSQQAVGVIVPGRGPGDVEDAPELADPFPSMDAAP